jgi:hypothetical protein
VRVLLALHTRRKGWDIIFHEACPTIAKVADQIPALKERLIWVAKAQVKWLGYPAVDYTTDAPAKKWMEAGDSDG